MNHRSLAISVLATSVLASCASGPKLAPVDSALLVEASSDAQASVVEARSVRDAADDSHAVAQRNTRKAEERVALARASLVSIRSQLEESKPGVEVANRNGSPSELASARARHDYTLARADEARELLAVRKREFELATAQEKLALE